MKIFSTLLVFTILILGCTEEPPINNQILGIWRAVIDESQLLELGYKKENFKNDAMEMKFLPNGTIEIRATDESYFKDKKVNRLLGIYKIENNRLKISFIEDVWDYHEINIINDMMKFEPIGVKGKMVTIFNRANDWGLKL